MGNKAFWLLVPLAGVLLLGACGRGGGHGGGAHGAPLAVQTVRAVQETVPVTVTAAGSMSSPHSVAVTAQISGRLEKVWVASGQTVHKGQVLFTLDAAPYRAALAEAQAKLRGAEAQARYATGQVEALRPLVAKDYVTRQSYAQAVATAQADRAQVQQDLAAVETARLNLGYTTLRAPIAGRLGVIALQPGNVVQANLTPLVTLRQMSPLLVDFSLPQALLPQVRRLAASAQGRDLQVLREDAEKVLATGRLIAVDNGVDPNTGTVRLQGQVDNASGALWPAQFVTVRLTLSILRDALVLPAAAVQPGQSGSFVYLVRDGKAHVQKVGVRMVGGGKAVIDAGISPRDEVIYPVPARMRPGAGVRVVRPGARVPAGGAEQGGATEHAR